MENYDRRIERRKSERVSQEFLVHATRKLSENLKQEDITGFTRDINNTGLSFLTDADYSIGDMLDLDIELASSQHHLRVRVTHIEPMGDSNIIGVAFLEVSPGHQKALMDELFQRK